MSAARHGHGHLGESRSPRIWRLPVIVLILVALIGAGLIDRAVTSSVPPVVKASAAAVAAPVGAESSSWFCTGSTGILNGAANGTLYLVNAGPRAVSGTLRVVNDAGVSGSVSVTVPAGRETTADPSLVVQGSWLASRVDLNGGGVTVSELVNGSAGWAEAPCSTTTSPNWYFASGSTQNGSTMYVSLYNPTTTSAIVDLSFVTPQGVSEPQPFEGLVVGPGALVVAGVASYVQNQRSVATMVSARSGRVVAEELEEHVVGGVSGLSLRLGVPAPADRWYVPRTVDVPGGSARITVLNPGNVPERVTVAVHLPSGPVAPFSDMLPADSSWALSTSGASRIPANTDYATTITASGGAGVVVDRTVQSASVGAVPQWGTTGAVSEGSASVPSRMWVVPTPAVAATPPVAGAAPLALALQSTGGQTITVTVWKITPHGLRRLAGVPVLRIPPGVFTVVEPTPLAAAGTSPLLLKSSGPLAAMEDGTPAGVPGGVAIPAIPQG